MDLSLISEREAAAMFARLGVDRETARRALRAGLIAPEVCLDRVTLYDAAEVGDYLAAESSRGPLPQVTTETLVLRTRPWYRYEDSPVGWAGVSLEEAEDRQLAALGADWRLEASRRILTKVRIEDRGAMPLLATVGGFVLKAVEIVGVHDGRHELRPAGPWADPWLRRHYPTGRGGAQFRMVAPPGSPWRSRSRAERWHRGFSEGAPWHAD